MTPARARRGSTVEPSTVVAPPRPMTVAVTGAASPLGDQVVRTLAADSYFAGIVAIDSTATPTRRAATQANDGNDSSAPVAATIAWRTADVRHPSFGHALDGIDVVVHTAVVQDPEALASERRAGNLGGIETLLAAASQARLTRLVIVSSAMVYGAVPDNPLLLTEAAPLQAAEDDSIVGDFVRIEARVRTFAKKHKDIDVVVLRPVTVVGPGCDGVLTRHFETARLLAIRGIEARWQFVHVADVASACALAARGEIDGAVNVSPPATLSQGELEEITGSRRVELPASVVFGAADRLHRAGVTLAPAGEIAYLAYPWTVDSGRLLEAGWRPTHDSAAALRAHLTLARSTEGTRRMGRDDATRAAAGATVALLGTAALMRRAKRRRV